MRELKKAKNALIILKNDLLQKNKNTLTEGWYFANLLSIHRNGWPICDNEKFIFPDEWSVTSKYCTQLIHNFKFKALVVDSCHCGDLSEAEIDSLRDAAKYVNGKFFCNAVDLIKQNINEYVIEQNMYGKMKSIPELIEIITDAGEWYATK